MALAMRCVNASSLASSNNAALIVAEVTAGDATVLVAGAAVGATDLIFVTRVADAPTRFRGACKIRIGAEDDGAAASFARSGDAF